MIKNLRAVFIGHSQSIDVDKEELRAAIVKLADAGVTEFLNGGMGEFDMLGAELISELKSVYPQLKSILVIPYPTAKEPPAELFDEVVFPLGLKGCHFKAAITARNRCMVDSSAHAICFINHKSGGAYSTYKYAKKQGLHIINLADFEE